MKCNEEILSLNLRRAVSKDVGLAGILLYIPTQVVDQPNRVAWTDGTRMYFAQRYFSHKPDEQVAIAIHEGLHVALRHVQRGDVLALREGAGYRHDLWNIACDAVVNQSIRSCYWCVLPPKAWFPTDCLTAAELKEKPAERWTAEEIYREMKRTPPQCNGCGKQAHQQIPSDLHRGSSTAERRGLTQSQSMEDAIWRERLIRAQAGSSPGSVLRRIAGDVPKPVVRWESVLRDFLVARLMPLTEASWGRPSRRTLALGRSAQWIDPGTERNRGMRRAGVVIDTSGSIDDGLLKKFLAEINHLIVTTGCEVVLVDCDASVQQVSIHRIPISGYTAKGGGGTDFRPALEALSGLTLDVAVYFTDLCGTFPEKRPSFPLLWLATKDLQVPFGRKVLLPHGGA